MPPHKHAPKPVTDTSVQSAGKVLQTRPFQPDVNTNQQAPQLQKEPKALTGGFDLTKIQYNFSPPPISPLGQPLQAKLTIGEPNDKYEQEADRVAHDMVQRSFDPIGGDNPNSSDGKNDVPFGQLLRDLNRNTRVPSMQASVQPMSGGWDLTKKVFVDEPPRTPTYGIPLQPKLTIGAPNDKYEQEADRVAKQVVQRLHAPAVGSAQSNQTLQRKTLSDDEDELQMKPLAEPIQRMDLPEEDEPLLQREVELDEEDELQMKPLLQRQESGAVAASDDLESAIQQSRGGGQSLADSIRKPMEQAFGDVDFRGVKVHTDGRSDQLNRSIQAKAFTTGQDIFFRQNAYQPGSSSGRELIAHELTHVMQQSGGAVQRFSTSDRGQTLKEETTRKKINQPTQWETPPQDEKRKNSPGTLQRDESNVGSVQDSVAGDRGRKSTVITGKERFGVANPTIQRMQHKETGKEIADVIIVGEKHNDHTEQNTITSKLPEWYKAGYQYLGIEYAKDSTDWSHLADDSVRELVKVDKTTLQALLDMGKKGMPNDDVMRNWLKDSLPIGTVSQGKGEVGVMITTALGLGFTVMALDSNKTAKLEASKRWQMEPDAAATVQSNGQGIGWVLLVGADHVLGIQNILEAAGRQVEAMGKVAAEKEVKKTNDRMTTLLTMYKQIMTAEHEKKENKTLEDESQGEKEGTPELAEREKDDSDIEDLTDENETDEDDEDEDSSEEKTENELDEDDEDEDSSEEKTESLASILNFNIEGL